MRLGADKLSRRQDRELGHPAPAEPGPDRQVPHPGGGGDPGDDEDDQEDARPCPLGQEQEPQEGHRGGAGRRGEAAGPAGRPEGARRGVGRLREAVARIRGRPRRRHLEPQMVGLPRTLIARDYSLLRQGIEFTLGEDLPDGVKVAIFKKIQNGFPLAHDFGTWCATTHRLINRTKTILG